MTRSPTLWICGVIVGSMAISASADPPSFKLSNRTYGNWVDGGSCTYLEDGYRCRSIQAWENYDVKGTFEYTEASFNSWRYDYDPSDGSYEEGWHVLTCPVDQKAISANPNSVTIKVALDPDAPGCYQWGDLHTWDPVNGDQWFPFPFTPGTREIEGEWVDPFSFGSSMWNQKDTYFDGWSGMTSSALHRCKGTWGDMMTRGGFTLTTPLRTRFYAFEGPDGPAWSSYNVSSCNDNEIQR
ncbi:MAG: hypothetical protein OEQ14_17735 [Gammaproteobacteria bacterium]|nr:hypothetical protein [Gammaproteobacteria bacterium]